MRCVRDADGGGDNNSDVGHLVLLLTPLCVMDPRIDIGIKHVHDESGPHIHQGVNDDDSLKQRIVRMPTGPGLPTWPKPGQAKTSSVVREPVIRAA